ncbi:MFS transporter [Microbacterium sp. RU33B]|uniref:MFS transporter n=1 Tax=Microbacterium sp. RU33B TaxID=1907390 RepID=UPI00096513BF|nr:MFS transporter [Microbacterium sp. RU33B]SIT78660.1 drug resistance transporter, EmrB/QacA subfamily [Microbacterium sp. RU33B]
MSSFSGSTPDLSPSRLRALLIVLCAALALVVAGNSALAIALPDIAADLRADQSQLTWIIDAYALTFAALLLTAGLAADRVGRRTILVIGLVVFGGASVASAFSPDPEWFIALRALSGVGAAAVFPVTLSALVDAYPEERRTFAIGVWSGVSSAGAVAGTIISGGLLEVFWWGSVQLLFGGVALALIVPVLSLVAQNRNPALSLDVVGAVWSVIALGGLVFGIVEGPQRGWLDALTLSALAVGSAGFVAFVVHQLRARVPSLDVRLFKNRGLAAGATIVTIQFFASLGFFVLSPQYLQIVLDYSPLGASLALLVVPLGVGAGIGASAALAKRFGARVPGSLGLLLMGVGFAVFGQGLLGGLEPSLWVLAGGVLVFGVGFGMGITPGTELIIEGLPAERRSVASAVNDITREVGGVLGIAVLSSILVAFYRDEIAPALEGLPTEVRDAADSGAGAALGIAEAFGPQGDALALAAREAFAVGLSASMFVGAVVLAVAAAIVVIVAPGRRAAVGAPAGRDAAIRTAEK